MSKFLNESLSWHTCTCGRSHSPLNFARAHGNRCQRLERLGKQRVAKLPKHRDMPYPLKCCSSTEYRSRPDKASTIRLHRFIATLCGCACHRTSVFSILRRPITQRIGQLQSPLLTVIEKDGRRTAFACPSLPQYHSPLTRGRTFSRIVMHSRKRPEKVNMG